MTDPTPAPEADHEDTPDAEREWVPTHDENPTDHKLPGQSETIPGPTYTNPNEDQ